MAEIEFSWVANEELRKTDERSKTLQQRDRRGLKEYLEADHEKQKGVVGLRDQGHEIPIHGEMNTISRGFSGGRSSASKRKRYARVVMYLEASRPDHPSEPDLFFVSSDLEDVVPHEDDPVVISVITVGRKVHKILIDQGSLANVMFWETLVNLQLAPD